MLQPATPPEFSRALTANLTMAVHTSLLMLPQTFTREQLYTVIAGLSYQGEHCIAYVNISMVKIYTYFADFE